MTPESTSNVIKYRERSMFDTSFVSLYYEMTVVLDYGDDCSDEELEEAGEPQKQLATLLAHRKSDYVRVAVFAHDKNYFHAIYTPGLYGLWPFDDNWSHQKFCEYLQSRAALEFGKPIEFIEDEVIEDVVVEEVDFEPVPGFSQRALEIWTILERNYRKKYDGMTVK